MKLKLFYLMSGLNMVMFSFYILSFRGKDESNVGDKILKVRGLVVVDSLGIERVIIGSHLPEPNWSFGYRTASRGKGGSVSGVMLYDHEGQERGGYVTDDGFGNAFLTLDSKTSQQALLLAEPQGRATFSLWDRGNNRISLVAESTNAKIELTKNSKKIKLYDEEK